MNYYWKKKIVLKFVVFVFSFDSIRLIVWGDVEYEMRNRSSQGEMYVALYSICTFLALVIHSIFRFIQLFFARSIQRLVLTQAFNVFVDGQKSHKTHLKSIDRIEIYKLLAANSMQINWQCR